MIHRISLAAWTRALLAPALVFIATAQDRNYQTDFWHHLARGRAMVENGHFINHDQVTYTVAGASFQDTNWLPQLLYYGLFCIGGLDLVQLLNSLTLAAMMGVLVWLCWRESGSIFLSGAVGAFTFLGLWQLLIIRPQTFSLLLFVALYAVLELAERRRRWLLVAPLLLGLWVNVHGGFPVGLALIGCFLLAAGIEGWWTGGWAVLHDRRVRALSFCMAASLAATFANPYRWRVYEYVGLTSSAASSRRIDEWLAPGLNLLIGKMLVVSILLLFILFALPGRRPRVRDICLIVCFLPFAVGSARMIAWWLLVAAPMVTRLLAANLPELIVKGDRDEKPSPTGVLIFVLLLLATLMSVPGWNRHNPLTGTLRPSHRPEDDLQVICDELKVCQAGRIFSRFEWSEFFGWELAPHNTVFMDGRIEIFPDSVWREYAALTRGRADWQEILDRYHVNYLVLDTAGYHAELLPQVERSPLWQRICQSGDGVLFIRRADAREVTALRK